MHSLHFLTTWEVWKLLLTPIFQMKKQAERA